ncbi:MAG: nuclear transport factor 2 family protein [Panacibacter sp.]
MIFNLFPLFKSIGASTPVNYSWHIEKIISFLKPFKLKMMNRNVETVKLIYEAFGKGDVPSIIDQLADDVQWEQWADNSAQKAGVPWMQSRPGKDGATEFFKVVGGLVIKDFQVLSIMGNEQQVAAEFIIEADVPETGGYYRDEEMHLWTFNEQGKVTRLRHYTDTAKHITAAKK